jgi:hypothetical protein
MHLLLLTIVPSEDSGFKLPECCQDIKEMPRCAYMMILQDIHERAKYFECVRFAHEGRNSNREAHFLAKYACSMGTGRHVRLGTPPVFLNVKL